MGTFFSSRIISFGRGPLPINLITTTQKEKNPFVTYKTINIHVHITGYISSSEKWRKRVSNRSQVALTSKK